MFDLQNLFGAIESKAEPTVVFFRDDDVGWAVNQLPPMVRCFAKHGIALDLAVIPGAINESMAVEIESLCTEFSPWLHLHQHGYLHTNHQTSGRKCEFGVDRGEADQLEDISAGRDRLANLFGSRIEPIFTPPWNRCTEVTTRILQNLEFQVLSRTENATNGALPTLQELPVTIDWLKKRNGERLERRDFLTYATQQFIEHDTVGIMLHHEHMYNEELSFLEVCLGELSQSPNIVFKSMLEIASGMQDQGDRS